MSRGDEAPMRAAAFHRIFDDPAATRAWVETALPTVYGFVFARCGADDSIAQDITQDTMVEVVKHRGDFDGSADPMTWVCAIARHKVADQFRAKYREQRRRLRVVETAAVAAASLEDESDTTVTHEAVVSALQALPEAQRVVLTMHYLDGLSVREIAAASRPQRVGRGVAAGTRAGRFQSRLDTGRGGRVNDTEIRDALRFVDRPLPVSPEFVDQVFDAMVAAMAAEPVGARRQHRRRGWPDLSSWTWTFSWRLVAAVVAAIVTLGAAIAYFNVARAPSALAALTDARHRFEQLPQYHARTAMRANENSSDSDFETRLETEDWYQDAEHWRSVVVGAAPPSFGTVGDYRVRSAALYGEYNASANVFTARPSDEADPTLAPSFFFDPSLQWWSTGVPGDKGKASDEFFEENCTAADTVLIGRRAIKLTCDAKPRDIELWLDDETGMLLRISVFDIFRELTSLEVAPDFPAGTFDATPPEGAKKRWTGSGGAPPEYVVALGTEVAARYQIVEGRTEGLSIAAATVRDLWILATRCGTNRCDTTLLRVDTRTGKVVATINAPAETAFDDVAVVGNAVWVSFSRRFDMAAMQTPPSFVQRLDARTNQLAGEPIETGTTSGGIAGSQDVLWTGSGRHRFVKVGPAESHYHSVARLDTSTGAVDQFDLGADAMSPIVAGDSVWVTTMKINARNPYETDYELVQLDASSGRELRRVALPGWPNAPVTDGARIYTMYGDQDLQWHMAAIDLATGAVTGAPVGARRSEFGGVALVNGQLWIISPNDGGVLKLDAATLQPSGSIATGPAPASVAVANGSIWVTHIGDGSVVRIDIA